ncbi:MAG: hypothetical protein HRU38_12755 [Saccharospirillaceae bacterium]|nr:DUF6471 domain-containing protein [Pseudomonadales bacterium]NRB79514.1 hypothetical protein [Saccharospirillaceae bacterium]
MHQDQSIRNKVALKAYKQSISRYIRSAMVLKGIKYDKLTKLLSDIGIELSSDNLRSKVSKGLFSADLLVAIIDVLEVEQQALPEILKQVKQ